MVFAALLVWFLGGNLTAEPVECTHDSVGCGSIRARLVQVVPPLASLPSERETWHLETSAADEEEWMRVPSATVLVRATDLVRAPDGALYFAGASSGLKAWTIFVFDCASGALSAKSEGYSTRFEAERQVARLMAGLSLQSAEESARSRDAVLHAGG